MTQEEADYGEPGPPAGPALFDLFDLALVMAWAFSLATIARIVRLNV